LIGPGTPALDVGCTGSVRRPQTRCEHFRLELDCVSSLNGLVPGCQADNLCPDDLFAGLGRISSLKGAVPGPPGREHFSGHAVNPSMEALQKRPCF